MYVNSTDQWHGRPLYTAIIKVCLDIRNAGASVVRCAEGGGSHQVHTTRLLEWSENLPVRMEIVDLPVRIEPLLVALGGMIGHGLVTVSSVHMLRFQADPKT